MFPTQAWKVRCHDDNGLALVVSQDEGSSPEGIVNAGSEACIIAKRHKGAKSG